MSKIPGLVLAISSAAFAQGTVATTDTFEVASVRLSSPAGTGRAPQADPTHFYARGSTLKQLILRAYDIQEYELSGGPKWVGSDRFDIDAKSAAPASRDRMLIMLQSLLADRFQLRLNHETKALLLN